MADSERQRVLEVASAVLRPIPEAASELLLRRLLQEAAVSVDLEVDLLARPTLAEVIIFIFLNNH